MYMTKDFEYFNDEWNETYIENSNPNLPRMERSIENSATTEE